MKESIKLLDIISPDIWFNAAKRRGVKSIPGVIASVIFVAGLISISVLLIINFFKRNNPIINQIEIVRDSYPRVNLAEQRILPFFAFELTDGSLLNFDQISKTAKITGLWQSITMKDAETETKNMTIGIVSCNDLTKESDYFGQIENPDIFNSTYKDRVACLDLRNKTLADALAVAGSGFQGAYQEFKIVIDQCRGSDPGCLNLTGVALLVGWVRPFIDTSNLENPLTTKAVFDSFHLLEDDYRYQMEYTVDDIKIEDELGPGFTNLNRSSYSWPQITATNILPNRIGQERRFSMEFRASNNFKVYKRIYPTLLNIVANFGGLLSLLMTVISLLFAPLLEQELKRSLAHSIYKVKQEEEIHEAFVVPSLKDIPKPEWTCARKILKCFKRKQTREFSEVIRRKVKDAEEMIEENLDVIGLIEKLNLVTVFAKMFLTEHDDRIVPAASLLFYQIKKYSKKGSGWSNLRKKMKNVKRAGVVMRRPMRIKSDYLPSLDEEDGGRGLKDIATLPQERNLEDDGRPVSHCNRR